MDKQVFIVYWTGEEPVPPHGPSPTLDMMPACVDIVSLLFAGINKDYTLDLSVLTKMSSAATIQGWIKKIQANGTKVLLCLGNTSGKPDIGSIPVKDWSYFVNNVAIVVKEWGFDGLDIDYEPDDGNLIDPQGSLVPVLRLLKKNLPAGSIFTGPIWSEWLTCQSYLPLLQAFAAELNYVTTMDYTPYPSLGETVANCEQYATAIGGWKKLVIGMSCMGTDAKGYRTPLPDVALLSAYKEDLKAGAMLYTFSYDVKERLSQGVPPLETGTDYADGTWTQQIYVVISELSSTSSSI